MGFDRAQLVFKALVALDEVVEQAGADPIEPSHAVRFALAYLHSIGKGDRGGHDAFWHILRDPMERAYSRDQAAYQRSSYARSALRAIAKDVGVELTVDLQQLLRTQRASQGERIAMAERIAAKDAWMERVRAGMVEAGLL